MTDDVEMALDEANRTADLLDTRYSADEIFARMRRRVRKRRALRPEHDLNEIVEYITCWLRNPAATDRFIDDVEAAIME